MVKLDASNGLSASSGDAIGILKQNLYIFLKMDWLPSPKMSYNPIFVPGTYK